MKTFRPWCHYLISFIVFFICFILFDYFSTKSLNWISNGVKSLFFVLFTSFFDWAFSDKVRRDKKD